MEYKEIAALFEGSPNLHYFTNAKTYELKYVNPRMGDFLSINAEEYIGKKCYDVIYGYDKPCETCVTFDKKGDFYAKLESSKTLCSIKFKSVNSVIETDNPDVLLNIGNLVLFDDNEESYFYKSMLSFMSIFRKADNFDKSVDSLLGIILDYYQCDGTCVFKKQKGVEEFGCAYNLNIKSEHVDISEEIVSTESIARWLNQFENVGDVVIDNVEDVVEHRGEYEFLKKAGVENLVAVAIKLQDSVQGFIVMTNPNKKRNNYTFLYLIATFIQDNLNRYDLLRKLKVHSELDRLTGCFNSSSYFNKLVSFKTNPPRKLGVVFCDINGLRECNERYGYEYGDMMILNSAQIMKQYFEPFYRIGGDEFVCFVQDLGESEFYDQVSALRKETSTNDKACFSVGCTWNEENIDVGKQVANADSLMYLNKQKYYQNAKAAVSRHTSNILGDLLEAIELDEFLVFLQPKIDLSTDDVIGAEALVRRFDTKSGKLVFPDNFIPMYEDEGIIRHVDLNVLEKVCIMLQEWVKLGKYLKIAVNFSRITLKEDGIVDLIVEICDKYNVPHELIVVEITERIGLMDSEVSYKLVTDLKHHGFQLSLDDFGCAYSNIVTLSKIDVDEVKIDKSLIDFVESNSKNKIIVQSIIDMCNRMDSTTTISEGIETKTQAELLKLFKCTHGQGYLYSRPIPSNDFFKKYVQ